MGSLCSITDMWNLNGIAGLRYIIDTVIVVTILSKKIRSLCKAWYVYQTCSHGAGSSTDRPWYATWHRRCKVRVGGKMFTIVLHKKVYIIYTCFAPRKSRTHLLHPPSWIFPVISYADVRFPNFDFNLAISVNTVLWVLCCKIGWASSWERLSHVWSWSARSGFQFCLSNATMVENFTFSIWAWAKGFEVQTIP